MAVGQTFRTVVDAVQIDVIRRRPEREWRARMGTRAHTRLATDTLIGRSVDEGRRPVAEDASPDATNRALVQTATPPSSQHSGRPVVDPQTRPTVDAICRADRITFSILL